MQREYTINFSMLSILILISFSLVITSPVLAVSEAAVLFLKTSPSVQANAMGETYGNITSTSPMAVIVNPASLGMFAQKNFMGYSYYPEKAEWHPAYGFGPTFDASCTIIGMNLNSYWDLPISIGLARYEICYDMGIQTIVTEESPEPIGTLESWEKGTGTAVSVAIDYHVRLSLGFARKSIESKLSFDVVDIDAYDFGLVLEYPLMELFENSKMVQKIISSQISPYVDPGFFYSKTNIGDKIQYFEFDPPDPLPRTVSVGINLKTGFRYEGENGSFPLLGFNWAREAEDLLIDVNADNNYSREYTSGLHDIDFIKNVLLCKGNGKILTKRGYELDFLGCYFKRSGYYEDIEGRVVFETGGWGVNYTQPLKILATVLDLDNKFLRLLSGISFEKHVAEYMPHYGHPLYDTDFESYVIRLQNFQLDDIF